ncbi:diguanylate cyclase domain-containing protein [Pseudodesulfovibrio sp.]|uniref:diguanylate cyclase domain-containing protein n=1 Tax=unclassified Pseudodesulfovibrio TaxID=2661612 RepID=UPI003B00C48E
MALETAERLRRTLAGCSGGEGNDLPPFTVSIGVADLQQADTAEGLQKRADEALYRAKENGRDRVERG